MRLTENTGRKNSPSVYHRTTLSGYIFATKACIDNRKLHGCDVWNAHNTVFRSKRSAICATV